MRRLLNADAGQLCIDGSRTREIRASLEKHRTIIHEMIEQGFGPTQIQRKLQGMYPGKSFKRTTVNHYCLRLREELYDLTEQASQPHTILPKNSKLSPYKDEIGRMLSESSTVTKIFEAIRSKGYIGSYSLLQQYCNPLKPIVHKTKKKSHSISRKVLGIAIWKTALIIKDDFKIEIEDKDMDYIRCNFPDCVELEAIIKEFRDSFSNKDIAAVVRWANTYQDCKFQSIKSFINGINKDSVAFYNSLKYEYSNGLLEGWVNKLKEVKRTMFGRASYALLRAKLLLSNKSVFQI